MTALFIDSTYDITLGILDDALGWVEFERFQGQKASSILQVETHRLLHKNNLKVKDLKALISIAGPGFYTGLRLSEGFADVLAFSGVPHYSFLSYEIPAFTGVKSGTWMTKAYRGEYFFHHWNEKGGLNQLVATKDLEGYLKNVDKSSFYIHSDSAIDDFSRNLISNVKTSHSLLKERSKDIFTHILQQQSKVESFYFRAPEDEFKVSV